MKIDQVELYKAPIRLKEPFVTSLGPHEFAENVFVVIKADAGIFGFGECSPFRTIHGESMDTAFQIGHYLAERLLGKNPSEIGHCMAVLDTVMYGNTSIKSAFDMALYDIAAQEAGLPLYKFLSGDKSKMLVTDFTVSIGEPDKMSTDAKKIMNNGFQIIKVKVGGSKELDVERIRKIRETVGETIPIRIDANQGWKADEALEILTELAPYNIQHCEEPIPRWDFMELSNLRRNSPIPIMADESCCDHHNAKRLIQLSACDLFNIKLGKSSGIFNALKIVQLAEASGIKMQVGGFLESRLGFTASAHLALVSKDILYYDFDTPLMFTEDPVEGGILYDDRGVVTVPDVPGLGARIDSNYLKGLTRSVI